MKNFKQVLKDKFDWDVSGLPAYTDEQSAEIISDLINSSEFLSRISVQEGNKGSEEIKLLSSSPTVQAATTCGWAATGGVVLTDVALSTKRLKIQEEYCNEDLNGTWAQLMNAAGANVQDTVMPMEDVMVAYYIKKTQERIQDLVFNGDTASVDPNLVHFDGLRKLWIADGDLVTATVAFPTIHSGNAFDALKAVSNAIPRVLKSNRVVTEILCGYETAQDCLDQIYNDKDFAANIEFSDENGELTFLLPTTTTRVRSQRQLDGTDEVYAVPYQYVFYGTDLDGDENGYTAKYNDYDEKLHFSVKWRSGINYVFPEYFVKLVLTAS